MEISRYIDMFQIFVVLFIQYIRQSIQYYISIERFFRYKYEVKNEFIL